MKITDKSVKNLLEAGLVFLGNLQVSNNQLLDIKSWATELLEQGIEPTDALVELATLNSSTASSVDVQHFMRELLSTAGYEIPDTEGILKIYLKQVMENIASKKLEIEKGLNEVSEIALRL
ncbi:MAG: hypothetical protein KDD53_13085, partial [Bdellovibrionales bacterium]|nr:hypothetical protein [Bdellovibrionales bacterium]